MLYISYEGMLEPLGQSQVLAYLEKLAADRAIHLVSFEKPGDWNDLENREAVRGRIKSAGIHWHPLRYHKRPSAVATAWDILRGTLVGARLVRKNRLSIVHARSYVAAVMATAIKRLTGAKFVFDMRGFWADERVDGGLWPAAGRMYRIAKWFERRFLLNADHVVSLTHAAVREIERFPYLAGKVPPITVIPTCADLDRFRPVETKRNGSEFVLGYVGSAGTWYVFEAVARCFRLLLEKRPRAKLLVVNRNEHDYIREMLIGAGVDLDRVTIRAATHDEIPSLMVLMDAGVFFIKPVFSKQASVPTKLAEFLGCGVPCLSNRGVGDMAEILEGDRVGVAIDRFNTESLCSAIDRLLALREDRETSERCRASALQHFSLQHGVAQYEKIYDRDLLGESVL